MPGRQQDKTDCWRAGPLGMRGIAAPHGEVFLDHVPPGDGVDLGSLGVTAASPGPRWLRHQP